jgi:diaminopimelate decarboxylase
LPRSINLGGGFGIPYFPGEQRLDLTNISECLESICADAAQRFPGAEIQLELGRYLVGEAGIYVTRVIDKKISRGHTFLVTDGGLNHHLAASGNFGQVIRKNYPVAIATRINDIGKGSPLSIVGPLCTPLDIIANNVKIGTPVIGDLIAIFQSGAYGASASPQNFLGHPPPKEILV